MSDEMDPYVEMPPKNTLDKVMVAPGEIERLRAALTAATERAEKEHDALVESLRILDDCARDRADFCARAEAAAQRALNAEASAAAMRTQIREWIDYGVSRADMEAFLKSGGRST